MYVVQDARAVQRVDVLLQWLSPEVTVNVSQ